MASYRNSDGKNFRKYFSIKKYGVEKAKRLAIEWRKKHAVSENGYLSNNDISVVKNYFVDRNNKTKIPNKEILEYIKENLEYKEDGNLYWKKDICSKAKKGNIAGYIRKDSQNRRVINIYGKNYLAHKIIDYLKNGDWYDGPIDHVDGNPMNNKMENLRRSNFRDNIRNIKSKGIYHHKKGNFFEAFCTDLNGKRKRKVFSIGGKHGDYQQTKRIAMKCRLSLMIENEYPENIIEWYKEFIKKEAQI